MTIELNTPSEIIIMLAKKIEVARIDKKITQKDFAKKAGMTYGSYTISLMQTLGLYSELTSLVKVSEVKTIKELKQNNAAPKRVRTTVKDK
jgi:transcriptional regulator with XRE-family HTH domain